MSSPGVLLIIPTRSLKPNLKRICLEDLAVGILIICIIGEALAIRFFVAILLPRDNHIISHANDFFKAYAYICGGTSTLFIPILQSYRSALSPYD